MEGLEKNGYRFILERINRAKPDYRRSDWELSPPTIRRQVQNGIGSLSETIDLDPGICDHQDLFEQVTESAFSSTTIIKRNYNFKSSRTKLLIYSGTSGIQNVIIRDSVVEFAPAIRV